VSLNVNGLPTPGSAGDKFPQVFDYMASLQINVLCIQETNTRYDKCPIQHRLQEITSPWFQSVKTISTWNKKVKSESRFQYGGCAIIARDNAADRYINAGTDPSGLGRWCWMHLRGCAGKTLLIVSAYRPCLNSGGADSVWSQHREYFDSLTPPRLDDPRDAFTTDLISHMKKFHSKGAQIVLCADTNFTSLIRQGNELEKKLSEIGLKDIVLSNNNRQQAPPTSATGSKPINCIAT